MNSAGPDGSEANAPLSPNRRASSWSLLDHRASAEPTASAKTSATTPATAATSVITPRSCPDRNMAREVATVPATTARTAVVATPTVSQRTEARRPSHSTNAADEADATRPGRGGEDDEDLVVGHVAGSQR